MTLPSKELLSKVLGVKVEYIRLIDIYDGRLDARANDLHITFEEYVENINIYEIAHLCKEWAYKNGYSIISGIDTVGDEICHIMKCTGYSQDYYYEQSKNYGNVFQACEWVLKETK